MPNNPAFSFSVEVARLGIMLICPDEQARSQLKSRYLDFWGEKTPDWQLSIFYARDETTTASPTGIRFHHDRLFWSEADGRGWISASEKRGELHLGSSATTATVDYFLRVAFGLLAFEAGGFMLHAAGILKNNKAAVFFGRSGSGKTTVARLSPAEGVLNDDLLLILPQDQEWIVYGTPFTNPSQVAPSNRSAALAGLFLLIQDSSVYLEPLSYSQALAELFACLPVISADQTRSQALLSRLQNILATYPVSGLHFRQDSSYWAIL